MKISKLLTSKIISLILAGSMATQTCAAFSLPTWLTNLKDTVATTCKIHKGKVFTGLCAFTVVTLGGVYKLLANNTSTASNTLPMLLTPQAIAQTTNSSLTNATIAITPVVAKIAPQILPSIQQITTSVLNNKSKNMFTSMPAYICYGVFGVAVIAFAIKGAWNKLRSYKKDTSKPEEEDTELKEGFFARATPEAKARFEQLEKSGFKVAITDKDKEFLNICANFTPEKLDTLEALIGTVINGTVINGAVRIFDIEKNKTVLETAEYLPSKDLKKLILFLKHKNYFLSGNTATTYSDIEAEILKKTEETDDTKFTESEIKEEAKKAVNEIEAEIKLKQDIQCGNEAGIILADKSQHTKNIEKENENNKKEDEKITKDIKAGAATGIVFADSQPAVEQQQQQQEVKQEEQLNQNILSAVVPGSNLTCPPQPAVEQKQEEQPKKTDLETSEEIDMEKNKEEVKQEDHPKAEFEKYFEAISEINSKILKEEKDNLKDKTKNIIKLSKDKIKANLNAITAIRGELNAAKNSEDKKIALTALLCDTCTKSIQLIDNEIQRLKAIETTDNNKESINEQIKKSKEDRDIISSDILAPIYKTEPIKIDGYNNNGGRAYWKCLIGGLKNVAGEGVKKVGAMVSNKIEGPRKYLKNVSNSLMDGVDVVANEIIAKNAKKIFQNLTGSTKGKSKSEGTPQSPTENNNGMMHKVQSMANLVGSGVKGFCEHAFNGGKKI